MKAKPLSFIKPAPVLQLDPQPGKQENTEEKPNVRNPLRIADLGFREMEVLGQVVGPTASCILRPF